MEDPAVAIRARLLEITGPEPGAGECALLTRLLRSYVAKTPPALERLAAAMAAGDVAEVQDLAHALKGSAANIGAAVLTGLFAGLEDAARDGRLPDSRVTLDRIQDAYERVAPVCARIAGDLQPETSH
ncbi:Hpt domain-containing protein [Actinoplanes sp. NPDC049681]|uniref:Hpt domain-containing protein n=1 Tax=Actinoplanes sp. NPDC049681 TaxID=3363905 RepID=UPI0037AF08BA